MLLLSLLAPLVQFACIAASPAIRFGKTTLVGLDIPTFQQDLFAGIPFAEPPLGDLRLRPPVLKTSLAAGTFNASTFGPACLQTAVPGGLTPDSMSEDCLTINVLRPTGTQTNAKLPVMFWTYGGGFYSGFSEIYNASSLVAQSVTRGTPVIYVGFNYRLGPLGFPQGQEADNRGALNLALRDQLAALEWVQLHIGAFGGDKDKVTVFGESAGSIMTTILFLNSPITSLARAAIFESGSQATLPLYTPQRRETTWEKFVRGVPSCASLATSGSTFGCLRSANTTEIFDGLSAAMAAGIEQFPWQPVIDGPGGFIPDLPSVLFKRGQFARLPFIAGTNLDEGTSFTDPTVNSSAGIFESLVAQYSPSVYPPTLDKSILALLKLYPDIPSLGSPFNTGNETFGLNSQYKRTAAILGDLWFHSQRRLWMETAAHAGVPTFAYLFTQPIVGGSPALGVSHGSEILYVYGAPVDPSPSSMLMSQLMPNYWISFATSLSPNDGLGLSRPEWPQFTPNNKVVIQLNGANTTVIPDDYRKEQMASINSDPAIWHH
ncbi:extracellular triacylglycerol lipase precursor [Mycena albidolilacea]|uniref:Carboxylic ester hydrolase n=1 Tax=Mycena albidolilacea TaxID=1033008 RepID=A0AAD6Z399_9AGAR|nr:extracellular triacylglycerol lipase precursor [Mycena albidolilacea]